MQNEIIFEFITLGTYTKVSAIDVQTGVEASVTCPKNLSQKDMQIMAENRLKFVMSKKK
jgi:hypothetical protein